MTQVGFVGLGKLGLPVALAIESKGHEVIGYDVNPGVASYVENHEIPYKEEGLQPLLDATNVKVMKSIGEVVARSEIVFLPVQTPHGPEYEGITRLPETRADFDYSYLKEAIGTVALEAARLEKPTTLAVISTCLPGTFEQEIKPLLNEYIDYVYTPQFIAMGTVLEDYLHPEFNLIGVENEEAADKLEDFYKTINDAPAIKTDVTTAEGIKVSYNTWITAKTVIANAWGEMAEKTGMNFSDIKKAWDLSTKRLISTKYTNAGMSDGGGCHPRDNIALSKIASDVGMSHNIWEDLMAAREQYEEWHADVVSSLAEEHDLPVVLLGRSFKPETNIETGSPAILVGNILKEKGIHHQHYEDITGIPQKAVYFIGTAHNRYREMTFPKGSVVIDPFGIIEDQNDVIVRRLGRK